MYWLVGWFRSRGCKSSKTERTFPTRPRIGVAMVSTALSHHWEIRPALKMRYSSNGLISVVPSTSVWFLEMKQTITCLFSWNTRNIDNHCVCATKQHGFILLLGVDTYTGQECFRLQHSPLYFAATAPSELIWGSFTYLNANSIRE